MSGMTHFFISIYIFWLEKTKKNVYIRGHIVVSIVDKYEGIDWDWLREWSEICCWMW